MSSAERVLSDDALPKPTVGRAVSRGGPRFGNDKTEAPRYERETGRLGYQQGPFPARV